MSYEMNEKNGEIPALEDVEVRKGQAGEMTESPVDELQALDKNINSMKACIDSCGLLSIASVPERRHGRK